MAASAKTINPSVSGLPSQGLTSTKATPKLEDKDITDLIGSLKKTSLDGNLPSIFIDTCEGIADLIDRLCYLPTTPPSLYIDIEGINLCRHGSVSIIQIFDSTKKLTYLVDIHTLGKKAFSTPGPGRRTLQSILESDSIPKVFFDVRNDSDALYKHYGINLAGIHDIQLMELATRPRSKGYVNGLAKCINWDANLTAREKVECTKIKDKGRALFAPELGGSYEVFNVRPLAEDMRAYCVQDVQFLPRLWSNYSRRLTPAWRTKVETTTKLRISESQSDRYVPNGRHKALGPW